MDLKISFGSFLLFRLMINDYLPSDSSSATLVVGSVGSMNGSVYIHAGKLGTTSMQKWRKRDEEHFRELKPKKWTQRRYSSVSF